jgi:hypothetical protein
VTRVHLVVDTGVDDALALVAAWLHPQVELTGMTVSAGNVGLAQAWTNTHLVLRTLRADVPVEPGPALRSDGAPFAHRAAHGPDGMAGLAPPETSALPRQRGTTPDPAATVVCLAPLTAVLGWPTQPLVASYARLGEANDELDPVAAERVRATRSMVHSSARARLRWTPARSGPPLTKLVDALVEHQHRRGVGIGDAETVLRLVGEPDPVGALLALVRSWVG